MHTPETTKATTTGKFIAAFINNLIDKLTHRDYFMAVMSEAFC